MDEKAKEEKNESKLLWSANSGQEIENRIRRAGSWFDEAVNAPLKNAMPYIKKAVNWYKENEDAIARTLNELEKDGEYAAYQNNTVFWRNVQMISNELIVLPPFSDKDLLNQLSKEDCDAEKVRELVGEFRLGLLLLEDVLKDSKQRESMFKQYILEILATYRDKSNSYRLLIPGLFLIIEGMLAEIFRIKEDGTQGDIKRHMSVTWDLYQSIYTNREMFFGYAFQHHVTLTNAHGLFQKLTIHSNKAGIYINRNAVMHGASNPNDWKEEDFLLLLDILFIVFQSREVLNDLFDEIPYLLRDELEEPVFTLIEYRQFLERAVKKKMKKMKKPLTLEKIHALLEAEARQDLHLLFDGNGETVEKILCKSNLRDIAQSVHTST